MSYAPNVRQNTRQDRRAAYLGNPAAEGRVPAVRRLLTARALIAMIINSLHAKET